LTIVILGINIPFVESFISKAALAAGVVVPIPICAFVLVNRRSSKKEMKNIFINWLGGLGLSRRSI
jgi:hypothetical protein